MLKKGGVFVCFVFLGVYLLCEAQNNTSGYLRMAYEAHKRGLYEISNSQIEKHIKENKDSADIDYAHLLYAINNIYLEDFNKAIESLNIIREKRPESAFFKDATSYLILTHLKTGNLPLALSLYADYEDRFSADTFLEEQIAQTLFSAATTKFREGDIKTSRELFNIISTKFSSSEYLPLSLYYQALTYYQNNEFTKAAKLLKSASDISNSITQKEIVADIYLKLGDCFFNERDYASAEHFFNRVRTEFPDTVFSTLASFQISLIEKRRGNLDKAVSILEGLKTSHEEDVHYKVLAELANVKMLQEKWTESETYLKEITELPVEAINLAEVHLKLGVVNFNMGNFEDAIIYFRNVVGSPASKAVKESAIFWLGYTYYIKNLFNDAVTTWDRLRIEYPESKYIHEILFSTGKQLYETKNYAEAEKELSELITGYPDSSFYQSAAEMLIDSKIQQGKLNDALDICEMFLETQTSATVSFLYGKTLFLLKDFKKAKEALEQIQSNKPSEQVEVAYYLAGIHERQGEITKAQEKYLEIITFFPEYTNWTKQAEEKLKQLKK